jgi:UPF0271 protein
MRHEFMVFQIDINCDMGESFGAYSIGSDDEVIKHISSANVACGFHGGDPLVMRQTVRLAKANNVAVGAHPGFPDLMGFGRRNMTLTRAEAQNYLTYQVGALRAFCESDGVQLQHIKPHGALYNMAAENPDLAEGIIESVKDFHQEPILVVLANSKMQEIAEKAGLKVAREAFADRAYTSNGTLVSRKLPGAVLGDVNKISDRVVKMAKESKAFSVDGRTVELGRVDSVCVHGDNPEAVKITSAIRAALMKAGVQVRPMGEFL